MRRVKGWNPEAMAKAAHPHLQRFWRAAETATPAMRLWLLWKFAALELPTTPEIRRWLRSRTRRHERADDGPCWVCGLSRRRVYHHIIQLKNGGTNARRNTVPICDVCHAHVHPHLPMPSEADETIALAARQIPAFDSRPRLVKRGGGA